MKSSPALLLASAVLVSRLAAGAQLEANAQNATPAPVREKDNPASPYDSLFKQIDTLPMNSQDLDSLRELGRQIERLAPNIMGDLADWRRARGARLRLHLVLLHTVAKMMDLAFDPKDVPSMNVAPPPGASISAGADPSEIKDPKMRREYEEAIAKNAAKAQYYRMQHELRKFDKVWFAKTVTFISNNYSGNAKDAAEIGTAVDELVSDSDRRITLKHAVENQGEK